MTPARLLVVDTHALVRRGLRHLLGEQRARAEFELAGEAQSIDEAQAMLEAAPAHGRIDLMVADNLLPDGTGADLVRATARRWPEVRVVLLGVDRDVPSVSRVFAVGAAGYLLKTVSEPDLLQALRTVRAGGLAVDPSLTSTMVGWVARQREAGGEQPLLTERQERILHLIGQGLPNRDIAERLGIAEKTVKNHVTQVLQRLGLSSRTEAAVLVSRSPRHHVPTPG